MTLSNVPSHLRCSCPQGCSGLQGCPNGWGLQGGEVSLAELRDLVNKTICILEDQLIRCTCIILVCQHYKGYTCFTVLAEEMYILMCLNSKSIVCSSYTLISISTEEMETEKVVEFIKFSCSYENMAGLVRCFENHFVGQLLLISVYLPQTREVLTPSYLSWVPHILRMSGKIRLLHGRNPGCDSLWDWET